MNNEFLFEAIGRIDEELITSAYGVKHHCLSPKIIAAISAAVLALVLGGWTVISQIPIMFNGENLEEGLEPIKTAKILSKAEINALGGMDTEYAGRYIFEDTCPNTVFEAFNISPLKSTRIDYSLPMDFETSISDDFAACIGYAATDSSNDKSFSVDMSWITKQSWLTGAGIVYFNNYEIYTMKCGAEARISVPDNKLATEKEQQNSRELEEQQENMTEAETQPLEYNTWVVFVHDNIKYFLMLEHDLDETKALLDTFAE